LIDGKRGVWARTIIFDGIMRIDSLQMGGRALFGRVNGVLQRAMGMRRLHRNGKHGGRERKFQSTAEADFRTDK